VGLLALLALAAGSDWVESLFYAVWDAIT